jgi:hypothetical protein
MKSPRSGSNRTRIRPLHIASKALLVLALSTTVLDWALGRRLDGFNVIAMPNHPFGSASAGRALTAARKLGATAQDHAAPEMETSDRGCARSLSAHPALRRP